MERFIEREENSKKMINYDEEIKKFSPSLEVDETEDAIYNSNIKDITDVVLEMVKEMKDND